MRDLSILQEGDDVYRACQLGKMHKLQFPKEKALRANDKLELVYTNVCCPIRTISGDGNKYLIMFIDGY